MAKYYINSGSLQIIYSTNKTPMEAACAAIWETNEDDFLDRYIVVDERGIRTPKTADELTSVLETDEVLKNAGWST